MLHGLQELQGTGPRATHAARLLESKLLGVAPFCPYKSSLSDPVKPGASLSIVLA